MNQLPETGFLRLPDVIGEEEITEEQAAANRDYNKQAEADAIKNGRRDKNGNPVYARRPTTARSATCEIRVYAWLRLIPCQVSFGKGTVHLQPLSSILSRFLTTRKRSSSRMIGTKYLGPMPCVILLSATAISLLVSISAKSLSPLLKRRISSELSLGSGMSVLTIRRGAWFDCSLTAPGVLWRFRM